MATDHPSHYSGSRFRKGLRAFVAGRTVSSLATLLLLFAVVRWLDPAEYGTYMIVWGLCEMAVPLTSLGLLPAVQQFLPRLVTQSDQQTLRRFVTVVEAARLTLILIGAAMVGLAWPALTGWLALPESAVAGWVVAALMVGVLGSRFAAELLESLLEQRDAQLVRALQPIGRLLGLLALGVSGMTGLAPLLWMEVAVMAATLLIGQVLLLRRLNRLVTNGHEPLDWREVRRFVAHLSLSQLFTATGDPGAVRLVVGKFLGAEAVGVFGFLQQLLVTVNRYLPSLMLANVVRPMLVARQAEGNSTIVGVGIALLVKLNVMAALLAVAVVWAGGDELIELAMGRSDVSGTGVMLGLLLLGLMPQAVSQVVMVALQVYRRPSVVSRTSLVSPITTLLAGFGAATTGLPGAAAGMAVGMWVRGLVWIRAMRGSPPTPIDWRGLALGTGLGAAAAVACMIVRPWVGGPMSALICFVALLVLGVWRLPLSPAERELLYRGLGPKARWLAGRRQP